MFSHAPPLSSPSLDRNFTRGSLASGLVFFPHRFSAKLGFVCCSSSSQLLFTRPPFPSLAAQSAARDRPLRRLFPRPLLSLVGSCCQRWKPSASLSRVHRVCFLPLSIYIWSTCSWLIDFRDAPDYAHAMRFNTYHTLPFNSLWSSNNQAWYNHTNFFSIFIFVLLAIIISTF